jgi:hypothetical protein
MNRSQRITQIILGLSEKDLDRNLRIIDDEHASRLYFALIDRLQWLRPSYDASRKVVDDGGI